MENHYQSWEWEYIITKRWSLQLGYHFFAINTDMPHCRSGLKNPNSKYEMERRMSELLACPYCGNIPLLDDYGSDGKIVVCKSCGLVTKFCETKEEVIKIWNTRHNPFCTACKEKDCEISTDGTCAMIRKYRKHQGVCEWSRDDSPEYILYKKSCSQIRENIDGTIEEQMYKYCPNCGKEIKEVKE